MYFITKTRKGIQESRNQKWNEIQRKAPYHLRRESSKKDNLQSHEKR